MVDVVATDNFTHDRINALRGQKLDIAESTAKDLQMRGLVKIATTAAVPAAPVKPVKKQAPKKQAAPAKNKMAPAPENKSVQTSGQADADKHPDSPKTE